MRDNARLDMSKYKKTKKRKTRYVKNITSSVTDNILYMDATTKIIRCPNSIYHIYKNGKFEMSIYPKESEESNSESKNTHISIIDKIGKTLNVNLRKILANRYNIPTDIKRLNNTHYIAINYLKRKLNDTSMETAKYKMQSDHYKIQNCKIYSPVNDYTCNTISITKLLNSNNNSIINYYIDGLLIYPENESLCHLISGKQHVLIIEDYIKTKYLKEPCIGSLFDGAHSYKNDTCKVMGDYIKQGKLTNEFLYDLVTKDIRGFIELSTLTVFKTGITYYEKMGYMRVGKKEKEHEKSYYNLFNAFLDDILKRFDCIFMPITDYITHKEHDKKKRINICKQDIDLVKLLLKELLPNNKFELVTLHDLYKLIDISVYSYDFFCLNQDNVPKAMLLYYILRISINRILQDIMEDLHNDNTTSYKHLQLESTAENKFIAEQHSLIPGIGKEYMGVFLPGPILGTISKAKQLQIIEKVSKVLVNISKISKISNAGELS